MTLYGFERRHWIAWGSQSAVFAVSAVPVNRAGIIGQVALDEAWMAAQNPRLLPRNGSAHCAVSVQRSIHAS